MKAETKDLGFGLKAFDKSYRRLNKDGTFNVQRNGVPRFQSSELYHTLISMSWLRFNLLVLAFYFVTNFIFATFYVLAGVEHLTGMQTGNWYQEFFDCFFFSSQTITTLGYGRIAPVGVLTSSIAAIESMIGLLGFALATGLLYGRFSKPESKIIYSKSAVIAPYQDINAFMFRIVNGRRNQLIEVEVEVTISMKGKGGNSRIFEVLPLERKKINLFPLSWTLVHPIDENSPLFGINTLAELKQADAEFIILIKAFDDTFSQTIYSRSSYISNEVEWGVKFKNIISSSSNGKAIIDVHLIDEFEKAELNKIAVHEVA